MITNSFKFEDRILLVIRIPALFLGIFILWFLFTAPASAANRGYIELRGTVSSDCFVSVNPRYQKSRNLNIVGGENNAIVARLVEHCVYPAGYRISFRSGSGGFLVSDTLPQSSRVDYSLTYENTSSSMVNDLVFLRSYSKLDRTGDVMISFPANPRALKGIYTDIIYITIEGV